MSMSAILGTGAAVSALVLVLIGDMTVPLGVLIGALGAAEALRR